ncbi:hypothetical protein ACL58G_17280 [Massilia sp. GER05]|uniref:hypothetical protein n=1 Tax=Massilia sp. GER05 TaxID=3394605 RepID=UPI003F82CB77
MMRSFLIALLCSFGVVCSWAQAAPLNGTWKFDRAVDYYGRTPLGLVSHFNTVVIKDGEARFSSDCAVRFNAEEYFFSDVFQPLTKGDVTEKQVNEFLNKNLGVSLVGTKDVYSLANAPATCARPIMEFFVVGDKLLIPFGATFYSYDEQQTLEIGKNASESVVPSILSNYKYTRLPLNYDRYFSWCRPKIAGENGRPQTTDKCRPDFYPYVADSKSHDPLMNIIGNHDYAMNGQEYTEGFSPPFKQKVAATFLVLPPMKRVVLVRVDDFDLVRDEERDVMSGVYLSIVNGKVIDQIEGCQFDQRYMCVVDGTPVARLTDSGKFERISSK